MEKTRLTRRDFLKSVAVGTALFAAGCEPALRHFSSGKSSKRKPNLVYIFADQWRAQDTGYAGNSDVITPNLDKLAAESVVFTRAVSTCPVCSPYRASLMTGQYPLTTGVFLNDIDFKPKAATIAQVYKQAGCKTAYIGKWHLGGSERSAFTPPERRLGFDFWRGLECTHKYNESYYYADKPVKLKWEGYDAAAQTVEACKYISGQTDEPFILFISWGPPHDPYHTAPEKYKNLFKDKPLKLRPNVTAEFFEKAQKDIAGYYAHIAALDDCIGSVVNALKETGLESNTILVFTSDHGDMLYSHGLKNKQKPWDESILVPFVIHYPAVLGLNGKKIDAPIGTPDIMPTLLGLSGIKIPNSVEGKDFSDVIKGVQRLPDNAALIMCPSPFGQYARSDAHPQFSQTWAEGREYRGIRTCQYTYVRDLNGPWLLYDNQQDPYQLDNLIDKPAYAELQKKLENILSQKLKETNDEFLPGEEYIKKWGYKVDKTGTIPWNW
jgi:arylsulfatase A-like enzyme